MCCYMDVLVQCALADLKCPIIYPIMKNEPRHLGASPQSYSVVYRQHRAITKLSPKGSRPIACHLICPPAGPGSPTEILHWQHC